MKKGFFLVYLLAFIAPLLSLAADDAKIENEIHSILDKQKAAWNAKNIEGFMDYYWKSESLTFQSGNNRYQGWQELLSRYKKIYSEENWGMLDFTDISIRILSEESAYVLGRWKVAIKASPKEGLFTLIFKKLPEGWRIIHDHTS